MSIYYIFSGWVIIIINFNLNHHTYSQMESSKDEAIFRAIIELTAQAEFKEASFQFFEKNKGTFEDTEENKLSHSDIHKDYIMIME